MKITNKNLKFYFLLLCNISFTETEDIKTMAEIGKKIQALVVEYQKQEDNIIDKYKDKKISGKEAITEGKQSAERKHFMIDTMNKEFTKKELEERDAIANITLDVDISKELFYKGVEYILKDLKDRPREEAVVGYSAIQSINDIISLTE